MELYTMHFFPRIFYSHHLLHPNIQLSTLVTVTLSNRQDYSCVYFNLSIFRYKTGRQNVLN